jgi:hypothetical protein
VGQAVGKEPSPWFSATVLLSQRYALLCTERRARENCRLQPAEDYVLAYVLYIHRYILMCLQVTDGQRALIIEEGMCCAVAWLAWLPPVDVAVELAWCSCSLLTAVHYIHCTAMPARPVCVHISTHSNMSSWWCVAVM